MNNTAYNPFKKLLVLSLVLFAGHAIGQSAGQIAEPKPIDSKMLSPNAPLSKSEAKPQGSKTKFATGTTAPATTGKQRDLSTPANHAPAFAQPDSRGKVRDLNAPTNVEQPAKKQVNTNGAKRNTAAVTTKKYSQAEIDALRAKGPEKVDHTQDIANLNSRIAILNTRLASVKGTADEAAIVKQISLLEDQLKSYQAK